MIHELLAFVLGAVLASAMTASHAAPHNESIPQTNYYSNQPQGNDDGLILETTTDA